MAAGRRNGGIASRQARRSSLSAENFVIISKISPEINEDGDTALLRCSFDEFPREFRGPLHLANRINDARDQRFCGPRASYARAARCRM